jgi:hypothetical protein
MNNQAFYKIWIVVIVVVLLAGGILAWQYFRAPEERITDKTANWKTYRNEEYGYSIKYPSGWKIEIGKNQSYPIYADKIITFVDQNGKSTFNIVHPFSKSGFDFSGVIKSEEILIPGSNEYLTKEIMAPATLLKRTESEKENPQLATYDMVYAFWWLYNPEKSGMISFVYEDENDPNLEIFDQMLSTFRFLE